MIPQEPPQMVGTTNGWAPWSAKDKAMHFGTGMPGGAVAYFVCRDLLKLEHPLFWAIVSGLVVGMTKEWWDRYHGGSPEYADALNTAMGFAVGAVFIYVVRF